VKKELLKIDDKFYWRVKTKDDSCDGGNTYGSVFSYNFKEVVAHIYDSEYICEDFNKSALAKFHQCEIPAEKHAEDVMKKNGALFKSTHSLTVFKYPSESDFVKVYGEVVSSNGTQKVAVIQVNVKMDQDTGMCLAFSDSSIISYPLELAESLYKVKSGVFCFFCCYLLIIPRRRRSAPAEAFF